MRALGGFLIAPLPSALFQALLVALQPKGKLDITQHPSSMFFAIILYFYTMGLLVGVPILLAMRKRHNHTLAAYAGIAGLIMLTPVTLAMIAWAVKGDPDIYTVAYLITFFGFGGVVAGALYWVITKPAREGKLTHELFR